VAPKRAFRGDLPKVKLGNFLKRFLVSLSGALECSLGIDDAVLHGASKDFWQTEMPSEILNDVSEATAGSSQAKNWAASELWQILALTILLTLRRSKSHSAFPFAQGHGSDSGISSL